MSRMSLFVRLLLASTAALLPRLAAAQTPEAAPPAAAPAEIPGIRVLETAGVSTNGKTTRLRFESDGRVPVMRVLDTDTGYGSNGFGGTISYYGERTQRLCTSPCMLEVPSGVYTLKAGESLLFGGRFEVEAMGGEQVWEVEDNSVGLGIGGILGTSFGTCGIVAGGMLMLLSDDSTKGRVPAGEPILLASVPLTALGIWMLVAAFGDAEQVGP
jgi:hypothetical protein